MQSLEDLTDRQAVEAVRSRIDWKYLLGLELTDSGFDYSALCEFRMRLIEGQAEQRLLNLFLEECNRQGWIKQRGKQRTDSTHVLASTRTLNRLGWVGETLRVAKNLPPAGERMILPMIQMLVLEINAKQPVPPFCRP